jgi:hypothetical protein
VRQQEVVAVVGDLAVMGELRVQELELFVRLPPVPEVCLIYLEFLGATPERKLRDLPNSNLDPAV